MEVFMTNFEAVNKCRKDLDSIETCLKTIRDNCGTETKERINNALRLVTALWQPLHNIDSALEVEGSGVFEL